MAIYFDLLSCSEVLEVLRSQANGAESYAEGTLPRKPRADLVTVMTVEKHPYDAGWRPGRA